MTDKIPKQIADRTQWTVEQTVEYARTGQLPANPEYVRTRNQALAAAGLEPDQTEPVPIEEMTIEEHAERLGRKR